MVEDNKIRRQAADQAIAAAEPVAAMAQTALQRIANQRAGMKRGERLPPIGWIPSLKESRHYRGPCLARDRDNAAHPGTVGAVLEFGEPPSDRQRRDYARLRRFLRAEARRKEQP